MREIKVIYACENNGYSEYTPTADIAAGSITARAEALGIEAFKVDGQDVLAVNALATQLVNRARRGEGPFFVELETYRYMGHHVGDINRTYYRPKAEEEHWQTNRDPINLFGAWLSGQGVASDADLAAIRAAIMAEAETAVAYALAAPFPGPEAVLAHVFAEQADA